VMETSNSYRSALMGLEDELSDARNMARITQFISEDCEDKELLMFAISHTADLADALYEKWNGSLKQVAPPPGTILRKAALE
jgi:hypothetical protein